MIYVILLSALAGALCVVVLQILLLYRNKPETVPRHVQYVKPVVEPPLKDYFSGSKEPPASPDSACSAPGTGGSSKPESCHFLNAIFLFLFRELRDTPIVRHWITKKIKVEFEELLQTKTAGRLLEGLRLRDISLGNALPVLRSARLLQPVPSSPAAAGQDDEAGGGGGGVPDELNFEVELEYNGGFHLAIDVDLVFGKSAYLFVKMRRVVGRLRLQFTRRPFTHWSFAFMDDPFIDFEVKSQFEGRPMPQLTSIIVNQLKRVIKRKHTLPNYKIRYKPFFPHQVVPMIVDAANCDLYIQQSNITEGRLKVTVVECSRLFILGLYDRTEYIHCTLELSTELWKEKTRSSIKTVELIKGNSQSVGLAFRQIQGNDGDAVHVTVETVTPNSPAAAADLQKGDRLIAIGGTKVTSSVHVLKLIKQAGEKVLVYYERPVGGHQNQQCSSIQENYSHLEDSGFGTQFGQHAFDDDGISDNVDGKDIDAEFEEIVYSEIKPLPTIVKEDCAPQSPKRSVATLASKPLGTISPILNRKLNLGNYPNPLKSQQKDTVKFAQPKCLDVPDGTQQLSKPPVASTYKPPVPPRPQIKLTSAPSEAQSAPEPADIATEKPDKLMASTNSTDKSAEKSVSKNMDQVEEASMTKFTAGKQDSREKLPEATCSVRDGAEGNQIWESSEILYRKRFGKWNKATCVFDVEGCHRYINVAVWCKEPFKAGELICLGHASIKLEEIAMECLCTASMEFQATFRLSAPEPKAAVSRTALRNLSTHKGFNEKLCYGDITLNFTYLKEGDTESSSVQTEKEKEDNSQEEIPVAIKEKTTLQCMDSKHNFQDTQFQNPTWCDYCKKKVWTKAASQCMKCAYICHKKCQDKCLAEALFPITTERRVDLETKSSFNRSTGLTRHIINTSSRLLNLRPGPRARLADPGVDLVEPSPKQTPNTSDNESSDTETYSASSPSKQIVSSTGGKLSVKKDGGLDDSVLIAVKEIGRDLYRGLPADERFQKLYLMSEKLQNEIELELEQNYALQKEEKDCTDPKKKCHLSAAIAKSVERLQALTLLTIHYKAGMDDLEFSDFAPSSEQPAKKVTKLTDDILSLTADEIDTDSQTDVQSLTEESNEQTVNEAESIS